MASRGWRVSIAIALGGLGGCVGLEGLNNPAPDGSDGGPDAATEAAPDTASGTDAPADVVVDTNQPETSDGATGRTIVCGSEVCEIGKTVCCVDGNTGARSCAGPTACANAIQACDDTKDCAELGPNGICCESNVSGDGGGYRFIGSVCVPIGNCDPNGNQDLLCDPTDPTDCTKLGDGRTSCQTFMFGAVLMKACGFP